MDCVGQVSDKPALSVLLTAQNDCPRVLIVSGFTLAQGEWDPQSTPVLGQQTDPATTGSWMSISSNSLGSVQGSLSLLVAQAGTLTVTWNLNASEPFASQVTKSHWAADNISAALVINPGDYAHVWVQLIVAIVVIALDDESLPDVAWRLNTDLSFLASVNRLPVDAPLQEGQRLLAPLRLPDARLWYRKLTALGIEVPPEDS